MTKTLPVLSFAKLDQGMPMPHLLDIQTRAFASLLQPDGKGAERTDVGLERVINGAVRVIVSQLHRSPGVVFEESIHPNGQRLFSARIIPFRGSWVEFTIDIHDVIYVHIDKKKKFPATALLRAFGYGTNADILKLFYATKDIDITGQLEGRAQKREVLGTLLAADVPDPENKKGEPLGKVGDELTQELFNTFRRAGIAKVQGLAGYTGLDPRDEAKPPNTPERPGAPV